MIAKLWHESKGVRDQDWFLDRTDWELVNLYGRPDRNHGDPEKGYQPVYRHSSDQKIVAIFGMQSLYIQTTGKRLRSQGVSEEEIQERYKAWAGNSWRSPSS